MAPADKGGVVDANLTVYGVKGLRVCDASVFPSIVSGHTVSTSRILRADSYANCRRELALL